MPTTFEAAVSIKVKELMALKVARIRADRLGMKLFPIQTQMDQLVQYERHGLVKGMQQSRGLGGGTRPVQLPGYSTFQVSPGYYGEHIRFDEKKLLEQRKVGDWMNSMSFKDMTNRATDYLAERYCTRYEFNVFQILQEGRFQADDGNGQLYWQVMYDIPKLTPSVNWDQLATSTPLKDLRGWMMSLRLGKSVDFTKGEMLMNGNTLNTILSNTNPADLGGKRLNYGQTINNQADQGKFFLDADLPAIRRYDEDYYAEGASVATRYIVDGRVLLSGKRTDGQVGGQYVQTPAVQNGGKPGEWVLVKDKTDEDNPYIKVSHGHNGVPVLEYPEAWASATVY
jgi:hypothetical protein